MDDTTIVNSSPASSIRDTGHQETCSPGRTPVERHFRHKIVPKHLVGKNSSFPEDQRLKNQTRLLYSELSKQKSSYRRHIDQITQALKILEANQDEIRVLALIEKWRGIAQAGMSYMLNSTLIKITKMGGYEELLRKEFEAERRKLEYQINDGLMDDMEQIIESEEFQALSEDMQQEYKDQMNERMLEIQSKKDKEIAKLEDKMKENAGQELTMQELAKRIKMDFTLIFPE